MAFVLIIGEAERFHSLLEMVGVMRVPAAADKALGQFVEVVWGANLPAAETTP
jgi:hypothetical protein